MIKIAVARRYAKALFGLVDGAAIEATKNGLVALAQAVSESPSLAHVLASPAFRFAEKRDVLSALSQQAGCPPIVHGFLAQLVKKNRVGYLQEIAEEFLALADRAKGTRQIEVVSAKGLSPAEQDSVRNRLRELLRHDVDLTFQADPTLLSGLQIRIGSTVYDSSVRSRLTAMRTLVTKE
ncbi:MAG: ATP synthase F1 subunit delta [Nitrospiraceae bacterium]